MTETPSTSAPDGGAAGVAPPEPRLIKLSEHTIEIVSDPGEGAQKCGQIFGQVSARMGNGVWTVEIIPAEIQPPARSPAGGSGNRIRIGSGPVTNWGDQAGLVVAFNEQVLLGRHRLDALSDDAIILLDSLWSRHDDERIREEWQKGMKELAGRSYRLIEVPIEEACLEIVDTPRRGKNMFVLGMLACLYQRDVALIMDLIAQSFRKKSPDVVKINHDLLDLGYRWANDNLDFRFDVPATKPEGPMLVTNGNQAVALGAIAAGMDLCAMYPITPATSVSHYLSDIFEEFGGMVHQAEDEIAAAGVAIGASYAGKVAFTVTSGPGLALKTEFLGLAVMGEIPLVVVDVQRGGPSTGLPTKVEQSDLLAALFGQPGDAPRVVIAPATIDECFHLMITARRIAETFRCVVIVLSDANLASGVQPYPRPEVDPRWMAGPIDQSPVAQGARPFDWDPDTGLSHRIIPGQPGGMHTLTGLAHDESSEIAYDPDAHERGCAMRSRKLAVIQKALRPPALHGDPDGDLLVVGWGSTKGAIEEAVDRARAEGYRVSSTNITFLSPLQPGLKEIFGRFNRVMTVEINYSDAPDAPYITPENRRMGQLAWLLRANTLVDVDCWTRVPGQPLRPGRIHEVIRNVLLKGRTA
ncbi:MAG: 2-oxoacid:acceptor oxidoreductase subunit alpha [Deltaproteobacteria bacterium]|nr:2-oxoacid:acceptor oxidoreductase subunit alpha [Deltaproteobacteria bacterium]